MPRDKADHLAMHGGTMVLIEATIIGLASRRREAAVDNLDRLSALRGASTNCGQNGEPEDVNLRVNQIHSYRLKIWKVKP
ncbi:hypothetical protein BPNPMPFG_002292 [Mesorhizobium sp. AR07]|uniref:hypothetical protein n=1 Tax=Mesorhizobium sp. AR07 TaxID=2865838 RepID=UPI0021601720|nr:hypothetical protein [Mesorhizobium sp. AR07]UVK46606.1 hypothetical protein BPNPMPFG_002292 [Mesorhizobium sp. AR07]